MSLVLLGLHVWCTVYCCEQNTMFRFGVCFRPQVTRRLKAKSSASFRNILHHPSVQQSSLANFSTEDANISTSVNIRTLSYRLFLQVKHNRMPHNKITRIFYLEWLARKKLYKPGNNKERKALEISVPQKARNFLIDIFNVTSFGAFAWSPKEPISFTMSVVLSFLSSVCPHGFHSKNFLEIWYWGLLRKSVEKIEIWLK